MKWNYAVKMLLLLTLLLSFSQRIFTQETDSPKELVGYYAYSIGLGGAYYILKQDGRYEYKTFTDSLIPLYESSGTYYVKDNLVKFKVHKYIIDGYDLFDPKDKDEALKKLSKYTLGRFKEKDAKKEFDMQIVKWGERIYLIEPSQLQTFAAAVNFKIEPRSSITSENILTIGLYLRIGDENKQVNDKPLMQKKWLSYIPDSPINVTVTDIEEQDKQKIVIVNSGSADGLKIGMCFLGKYENPESNNLMWVISVKKYSAKLKFFNVYTNVRPSVYQVGDILTTEYYLKR